MMRCISVLLLLSMSALTGCAVMDAMAGVKTDPVTGERTQDPSGGPIGILGGLLGYSGIATISQVYGRIRRREYLKAGMTVVSSVNKIRAKATANRDGKITIQDINDILSTEQNANQNRQLIREKMIAPVEHNGGGVPKLGILS